jgi:hypothetical protein
MITGIWTLFQEGNILSPVRVWIANKFDKWFGRTSSKYIQKPLWDCLPCMASVWGILLSWSFDIRLLLALCGLNAIIAIFIDPEDDERPVVRGFNSCYPHDIPTLRP